MANKKTPPRVKKVEVAQVETTPGQSLKTKRVSDLMRDRRKRDQGERKAKFLDILKGRPISYSSAKRFLKSPWHFMEYYLDDEKVKTDYFDTGTLFEMMLLEPQTVDDKVVTAPEVNRRTKAGREEYDNFLKENEGKFVVSQEVLETSLDMYERAIHDPEVKEWLPRLGHYQETKIYTHPATGLKAISKIDCRTELDIADPAIVDVKTMGKVASPQQWERDMYNLEYWLQAGAYCYAYQRTHFVFPDFYWMVFESKPPYGINIIKADPAIIDEGIRVWDNILKGIKFCLDEDLWHHSHKFWRLMAPYDTVRMPNYHKIRI